MKNIHVGGQNKNNEKPVFFRVGTLFVMSEDSLTIGYNKPALNNERSSADSCVSQRFMAKRAEVKFSGSGIGTRKKK